MKGLFRGCSLYWEQVVPIIWKKQNVFFSFLGKKLLFLEKNLFMGISFKKII